MQLVIQVERDPDDGEIIAVYVRVSRGAVARTIEICPGECYANEDESGNLLGVELLAPGELRLNLDAVCDRYPQVACNVDAILMDAIQKLAV